MAIRRKDRRPLEPGEIGPNTDVKDAAHALAAKLLRSELQGYIGARKAVRELVKQGVSSRYIKPARRLQARLLVRVNAAMRIYCAAEQDAYPIADGSTWIPVMSTPDAAPVHWEYLPNNAVYKVPT